jgi:hypothetical protein
MLSYPGVEVEIYPVRVRSERRKIDTEYYEYNIRFIGVNGPEADRSWQSTAARLNGYIQLKGVARTLAEAKIKVENELAVYLDIQSTHTRSPEELQQLISKQLEYELTVKTLADI